MSRTPGWTGEEAPRSSRTPAGGTSHRQTRRRVRHQARQTRLPPAGLAAGRDARSQLPRSCTRVRAEAKGPTRPGRTPAETGPHHHVHLEPSADRRPPSVVFRSRLATAGPPGTSTTRTRLSLEARQRRRPDHVGLRPRRVSFSAGSRRLVHRPHRSRRERANSRRWT